MDAYATFVQIQPNQDQDRPGETPGDDRLKILNMYEWRGLNILFLISNPPSKNNLNFHPLEDVSRYRDPQLQVGKNHSYLYILYQNICQCNIF